jgi:predicted phosphohydrolase
MITGDISIAKHLVEHLSMLESVVARPVYFVLGNHDYYGASVERVRKMMNDVSSISQYLKYLPTTPYVALSPSCALVGHDGWYDAACGDVNATNFIMRDWELIADYSQAHTPGSGMSQRKIIEISRELANVGVAHVAASIKAAVRYHKIIVVATHFPPFEEAHTNNPRTQDPGTRPWYTSRAMGDMLKSAAAAYPNVRFEVFSGHAHGRFDMQVSKNLHFHVGNAEYGAPRIVSTVELP